VVLDASALLAILLGEPERDRFIESIALTTRRLVSAATVVECGLVLISRRGEGGIARLNSLLHEAGVEIAAVDSAQAQAAVDAFRRFGKGRHPAGLNFGDCFAYALASLTGERLLYKGDDFAKTDIAAA
jgi:ribonuclease VapC